MFTFETGNVFCGTIFDGNFRSNLQAENEVVREIKNLRRFVAPSKKEEKEKEEGGGGAPKGGL